MRAPRLGVILPGSIPADAAEDGGIRSDVSPDELARYCVHALGAARDLRSKAALERLVEVTLAGLRAPLPET